MILSGNSSLEKFPSLEHLSLVDRLIDHTVWKIDGLDIRKEIERIFDYSTRETEI